MARKRPPTPSAGRIPETPIPPKQARRLWTPQTIRSHLLEAPPFVDCPDQHIRADTTSSPSHYFRCRHWSPLVLTLTDVLHVYFATVSIIQGSPQDMAQQTQATVAHLEVMARLFFALRERKILSTSARRYVHKRPMLRKLQDVSAWLQSVTPDDYLTGQHLLRRALTYERLYQEVYAMVRAHGPDICRTAFSREACDRVCAAILIHFDLATDDPQQVETADVDDAARLTRVAATVGRYVRAHRPRR